jgi:hypothetical protein
MRTTIALATFLVAGAGAVGVSALDLKGSDTLEGITRLLLTDAALDCGGTGNTPLGSLVYVGTGSTNGESAINSGAQQVGPMSRALGTAVCTALPTTNDAGSPSEATSEGIVFALDGLAIVASNATGGADTCNGTTGAGCSPAIAKGIAHGNVVITVPGYVCPTAAETAPYNPADSGCVDGQYKLLDSADALRLVYMGFDHDFRAASSSDLTMRNCGNGDAALPKMQRNPGLVRAALVENWGNLFRDPVNCPGCVRLWHAFRRNDESGTTDTFVSLLGRTAQVTAGGTASVAIPSINQAGRRSPFCNTRLRAASGTISFPNNVECANADGGGFDVVANPNGMPFRILGFNLNESSPANAEPPPPPTAPGGPAAAGHVNPKPGWDFPDAEYGLRGNAPYYTDFHDADCIRRQCSTPAGATQQEQVCSARGDLGLVLPIWDPPATTADQDPFATTACAGRWQGVRGPRCTTAPNNPSVCPNGEKPIGAVCAAGNPGTCLQPYAGLAPNYDFRCVNNANNIFNGQRRVDGRVYNLHCHTNNATTNPQFPYCPVTRANPDATGTIQVDMVGAYYRIHQDRFMATARPNHFVLRRAGDFTPLAAGVAADSTPGGATAACNPGTLAPGVVSATRLIGCLVGSANRCAIGYAGREAATLPGAEALRLDGILPDPFCVREPVGSANRYPLSRKLYLNATKGFETVTGDELKMARCFAQRSIIDPKVLAEGFITLTDPAGSGVTFCEDFNEQTLCGAPGNTNACSNNVAPIPQ